MKNKLSYLFLSSVSYSIILGLFSSAMATSDIKEEEMKPSNTTTSSSATASKMPLRTDLSLSKEEEAAYELFLISSQNSLPESIPFERRAEIYFHIAVDGTNSSVSRAGAADMIGHIFSGEVPAKYRAMRVEAYLSMVPESGWVDYEKNLFHINIAMQLLEEEIKRAVWKNINVFRGDAVLENLQVNPDEKRYLSALKTVYGVIQERKFPSLKAYINTTFHALVELARLGGIQEQEFRQSLASFPNVAFESEEAIITLTAEQCFNWGENTDLFLTAAEKLHSLMKENRSGAVDAANMLIKTNSYRQDATKALESGLYDRNLGSEYAQRIFSLGVNNAFNLGTNHPIFALAVSKFCAESAKKTPSYYEMAQMHTVAKMEAYQGDALKVFETWLRSEEAALNALRLWVEDQDILRNNQPLVSLAVDHLCNNVGEFIEHLSKDNSEEYSYGYYEQDIRKQYVFVLDKLAQMDSYKEQATKALKALVNHKGFGVDFSKAILKEAVNKNFTLGTQHHVFSEALSQFCANALEFRTHRNNHVTNCVYFLNDVAKVVSDKEGLVNTLHTWLTHADFGAEVALNILQLVGNNNFFLNNHEDIFVQALDKLTKTNPFNDNRHYSYSIYVDMLLGFQEHQGLVTRILENWLNDKNPGIAAKVAVSIMSSHKKNQEIFSSAVNMLSQSDNIQVYKNYNIIDELLSLKGDEHVVTSILENWLAKEAKESNFSAALLAKRLISACLSAEAYKDHPVISQANKKLSIYMADKNTSWDMMKILFSNDFQSLLEHHPDALASVVDTLLEPAELSSAMAFSFIDFLITGHNNNPRQDHSLLWDVAVKYLKSQNNPTEVHLRTADRLIKISGQAKNVETIVMNWLNNQGNSRDVAGWIQKLSRETQAENDKNKDDVGYKEKKCFSSKILSKMVLLTARYN